MSAPQRWTGSVALPWSATPPPPRTPKYDRLKVEVGKGLAVVILSHHLEENRTHFHDRRTVPCTGEQGECWLDHRVVGSPRYCGWLAVKLPKIHKPHLLSLTAVAVHVERRLRDPDLDLRGLTLRVWRIGNHERTEMHAALELGVPRVVELPQSPDVRWCVERLLSADDRAKVPAGVRPGMMARAFAAAKGGVQ